MSLPLLLLLLYYFFFHVLFLPACVNGCFLTQGVTFAALILQQSQGTPNNSLHASFALLRNASHLRDKGALLCCRVQEIPSSRFPYALPNKHYGTAGLGVKCRALGPWVAVFVQRISASSSARCSPAFAWRNENRAKTWPSELETGQEPI